MGFIKSAAFLVLKPLILKIIKSVLSDIDNKIDTGEEREVLAGALLDQYRPQIVKAMAKAMEKGHIVLESKGF